MCAARTLFRALAVVAAVSTAATAAPPPPTAAAARAFPPRAYNPCNGFNCDMSSIGEATLRSLADAIAVNGMLAVNFSWFLLDDGIVSGRDASGALVPDAAGFPSGIRALADYVNARGLALGAYTDRGTTTCEGRPGAAGHEAQDAATWTSWGVTWLKEDSCASSPDFTAAVAQYGTMKEGLAATGVDVFFSLCGWFSGFAGFSALPLGDAWRIGTDVPTLARFTQNIEAAAAAADFTGPFKGWPDLDMIGGHWSADEERFHVCFIALVGAPLILSWDVRDAVAGATLPLSAYLNPELLAIHADDAAPAVRARGHYYARVAGGAVTGAGTVGIVAGAAAIPIDTSVSCDSPRAAFAWTPDADGLWGTLEAVAAPGMCLGIWDEWTGACIDAIAAQLVPCAGNTDGCDARALKWSVGGGASLAVNLSWGGGTPLPGPFLTQVGGVPSALFVEAAAPAAPPLPLAQAWTTNVSAGVTTIRGDSGACLGVGVDGAGTTNVWARWLAGGDVALLFFNLGANATTVECDAACFERVGCAGKWAARDVWARADAGVIETGSGYVTGVLAAAGGSVLLRLTPA
jgi:alpha-galactosidase